MGKVERRFGKGVAQQIVSADLDAITGERLQQAHIEVERDHRARIAYPRGKQPRRRAGPSAHVETTPARANSDRIELPDRVRIEDLLQERQPRPLELFGPVLTERVLSHRQDDVTPNAQRAAPMAPVLARLQLPRPQLRAANEVTSVRARQFLGGRGELLIAHDRTRATPMVECTGDHLLNS